MWNKMKSAASEGRWDIIGKILTILFGKVMVEILEYFFSVMNLVHMSISVLITACRLQTDGTTGLSFLFLVYLAIPLVILVLGLCAWAINQLFETIKKAYKSVEADVVVYSPKYKRKRLSLENHGEFEVIEDEDPQADEYISQMHY